MKIRLIFVLLLGLGFSFESYGFVENSLHGYANCMTCHYAPAGGDLLNDYGRSLSSEFMSTWSKPGAEKPFGGIVKETPWAKFGGDFRTLQSYVNSERSNNDSFFIMQNNVCLLYTSPSPRDQRGSRMPSSA